MLSSLCDNASILISVQSCDHKRYHIIYTVLKWKLPLKEAHHYNDRYTHTRASSVERKCVFIKNNLVTKELIIINSSSTCLQKQEIWKVQLNHIVDVIIIIIGVMYNSELDPTLDCIFDFYILLGLPY